MIAGMGLGGVWERLERFDRRVLGQQVYAQRLQRPVLFRVGMMTAVVVVNVLVALRTGSTWSELTDPPFLLLAAGVIVTPFLVLQLRDKARRAAARGDDRRR